MTKLFNITGKALSGEWGTDDENGNGIPVLRTTNFTNEGIVNFDNVVTRTITRKNIEEKFLRTGDIIIEKSGGSDKQPVGRVIYYDGPENKYLFNNFTGLLRIKNQKEWFPRYVFYSLYANYRKGGTRAFENKTTGLHNLKIDDYIERYEVADANYEKQISVCYRLDKISDIIEKRKAQLAALDALVKARFVEMFGDVEYNTKSWPIQTLDLLCSIGSSKRIYQNEQTSEGIPFWRVSDLVSKMDNGFADSNLFISEKKYDELKQSGLVPVANDILVTSRGTLGRCYIIKEDDQFYFQDGMISWLSNYSEKITPLYLQYLFMMPDFRKQIDSMQAGSTVAYLSIAMLKKLKVMVPSKELQSDFSNFVSQVDKTKANIQKSLEKSQLLFDSLMQEYFG
ncbi:restriction endonuclease subunit S [bacterium]|nr:restriction endonuclease subunit S [bacterium]